MITPDPILMNNENGRLFEFELGRLEKIKKPTIDGVIVEEGQPEEFEEKWTIYKFN